MILEEKNRITGYLREFRLDNWMQLFNEKTKKSETMNETIQIDGKRIDRYINEFWTSKQRQSSSIHEISYRACFKAQLPSFFINLLSKAGDR